MKYFVVSWSKTESLHNLIAFEDDVIAACEFARDVDGAVLRLDEDGTLHLDQ